MEQEQELAIIRRAYAKQIFLAQAISPVAIIPCDGARDETSDAALAEAFKKGDCKRATRLYRNEDIPDDRCWLRASGRCLAYD
jgi:protein-L-isoaspartate(D-aspartate) O-methyltransferase